METQIFKYPEAKTTEMSSDPKSTLRLFIYFMFSENCDMRKVFL